MVKVWLHLGTNNLVRFGKHCSIGFILRLRGHCHHDYNNNHLVMVWELVMVQLNVSLTHPTTLTSSLYGFNFTLSPPLLQTDKGLAARGPHHLDVIC